MPLDAIFIDWDGNDGTKDDRAGSMAWGYAPRTDPKNPHTFFYTVTTAKTYQPRVSIMDHWQTCSSEQSVAKRISSCAGKIDDVPGWYPFNGTVTVE